MRTILSPSGVSGSWGVRGIEVEILPLCDHVRANVGIDGQEYARFGTKFGNQIIVIDRDGQTTDEAALITGSDLSVRQAFQLLEGLSKEDVYALLPEAVVKAGLFGPRPTALVAFMKGVCHASFPPFASFFATWGEFPSPVATWPS